MTTLTFVLFAVCCSLAAYLLGSIPFGLLIGKINGVDIRTQGSCNIGATNVTRVVGKWWGKLCFFCDFAKGLLPVLAVRWILRCADLPENNLYGLLPVLTALFAVLGHIFPVYLKFKGGKGVSTVAGVVLALNPLSVLIAGAVWAGFFFSFRYVSLASLAAAAALPLSAFGLTFAGISMTLPTGILLIFFACLTILKHRTNIQRLLNGTENRFDKKKKEN
ncbi:MAG: glycerol-3-phosphate 1-O-acyltransferase PlsY [Lentisphaeria bacterium]|nr:glycerol-3-phosphate 1-O-acyltransferase PlsY [Lentisphaeria bacterium]